MATLSYEYPEGVTHTFNDGDYVELKVPSFMLYGVQKYQYIFDYLRSFKNGDDIKWRVDTRNISLDNLTDGTYELKLTEAPKKPLASNNESNEILTYQPPSAAAIYATNRGGKRSRRRSRKSRKSRKSKK